MRKKKYWIGAGETCSNIVQNWSGKCVAYETCGAYELQRSSTALDFLRNNFCYYSGRDPVVCCPSGQVWKTVDQQPTTQRPTTEASNLPSALPQADTSRVLYKPFCGFSGIKRYKVVGGQPAPLGQFWWTKFIFFFENWNPMIRFAFYDGACNFEKLFI